MNRREALKVMTAIGALSIFPGMLVPGNPGPVKYHFVGLGGGGCNALEYIYEKGVPARYTEITRSRRNGLPAEIGFINFGSPGKYYRDDHLEDDVIISPEIENILTEDDFYILLAGFGGATGTNLARELSLYLSKRNRKFMVICSMPFRFEGEGRRTLARQTRGILEKFTNFRYFEMEMIRISCGHLPLSVAFERADEEFYNIFRDFILP